MSEKEPFVVAIDGPAGAGKSSVSKQAAASLGLGYLDSGAIYRGVALAVLRAGVDLTDATAAVSLAASVDLEISPDGEEILLEGQDVSGEIRSATVGEAASVVSAHPSVREVLIARQRQAVQGAGAVIEGRDIGTVIFPKADLKIFLDADPVERARRRGAERGLGEAEIAAVALELQRRDERDRGRAVAPLTAAADAVVLDTTEMPLDDVVARVVELARQRRAGGH